MDLSTTYMGLKLKNPVIASASPLSKSLDNLKKLEDAGAAAIVNYSLFEEEITHEIYELDHYLTAGTESFAESLTYFPKPLQYDIDPDDYLEHIYKAKKAVDIPIIASLNAHSEGGWVTYAKHIQQAGADALELNIYFLATDPQISGQDVENIYLEVLKSVKSNVVIPVAVKISPFFSSMANMAKRLDEAGADALVLFNRFYQPDIDLSNLAVVPNVLLSTPQAMRLPLRWVAILYGQIKANLAATGGIHGPEDVIKMLMAGSDVTMLCSALLQNGIPQLKKILEGARQWMEEHEYVSVSQMQGSMSQKSCADPKAFERANYMKALQSFK
ncbi:MAG: dihydroorotate dehydrogenase-like protein [Candidatus Omnitrophica bacterium]|nr:dihydroorotate dehydrogenase-like protein [Candidatus Omnitrophota bacterium]MDE2008891.1 dihydroorotate dehydrogenase-like protein [Candidatus Omnitrophota bacterium]MDE2213546.1 dihydroorotate dehydrogenase-like protein [Candidatus Omnitrophota bacterium]MDE2230553.1 dihydroorotate dehydrogenase-like protein [Candidatus Omnitrophota bacterium]